MTVEQILLSGISGVTAALVFLFRLLWTRSEECERDRRVLRDEIEEVKTASGINTGTLKAMEKCREKTCPFKPAVIIGLITAALAVAGCSSLDGYDRSYSVGYQDRDGHDIKAGLTLHPRDRGLAK